MPPKTINYAEIIDVGNSKIKTKNGNIYLAGMTNADEVINKFNELINQGKINRNQLEKKVNAEEIIWRKSILPSFMISLPFWGILLYFWPFNKMWFALGFGLVCGLIFFFVSTIVQWVVKKRLTNDKAG
jgi:lipopolysaccharide export LptBFGC system permease protein LptF